MAPIKQREHLRFFFGRGLKERSDMPPRYDERVPRGNGVSVSESKAQLAFPQSPFGWQCAERAFAHAAMVSETSATKRESP